MATAKFNGKSCPMCGAEFIAGESQIEPHPSMHGPRGGKVWVCAEHVHGGGAHENPRSYKKGKGKFRETAQSHWHAQAARLEESGMGGYEHELLGAMPGKKFRRVGNPFSNAGRRLRGQLGSASTANLYQKGKMKGKPRLAPLPKAASCDYSAMPVGVYDKATKSFSGGLVAMAAKRDEAAIAELARRGRAITGHKLAWQKKPKSNPFSGFGFSY